MAVEHAEQALDLTLVAVDRGLDLLREVAEEDVGLAHHRTDAAHLEHQPLQHARAPPGVLRHQPAGLLGEVDEDRARLEDREVALVVVDDRRDATVGVDGEEPGLLLLVGGQVEHAQQIDHAILHGCGPRPVLASSSRPCRPGRKQAACVSVITHSVYALSGGAAAPAQRTPLHFVQDACAGIAGSTGHENAGCPPGHRVPAPTTPPQPGVPSMSYEIRSILYASDLTPRSPAVFRHAVGLAMKFNAKLHAVTVTLPSSSLPYEEFLSEEKMDEIKLAGHKKAEALLRHRIDVFAEANPELDVKSVLASVRALEGDPSRRILDVAKHVLADVIVRDGLARPQHHRRTAARLGGAQGHHEGRHPGDAGADRPLSAAALPAQARRGASCVGATRVAIRRMGFAPRPIQRGNRDLRRSYVPHGIRTAADPARQSRLASLLRPSPGAVLPAWERRESRSGAWDSHRGRSSAAIATCVAPAAWLRSRGGSGRAAFQRHDGFRRSDASRDPPFPETPRSSADTTRTASPHLAHACGGAIRRPQSDSSRRSQRCPVE